MSWVTIIWSMLASVCLTLATVYLLIWFRERSSRADLCYFVLAVGLIGMAGSELAAMHAKPPTEYGAGVRWGLLAYGYMAVGSLGFVQFYFGTGKGWLLGTALGLLAGLWTSVVGGLGVAVAAEPGTNIPTFVVKSWRTSDGLPQNSVLALAQTPEGYLWVGTRGGLARFDGVRFRSYGLADGLKGLSIWTLAEDGRGGLWIGTLGGGLSHWHDGKITTWTTADGLAHNDVMALAAAGPGAVWVGTKRGLQHYGPGGFAPVGDAEGLGREVVSLATDRDGGLWVTMEPHGLYFCKDGRCELVPGPPELPLVYSYSLVVDTAGDLWLSPGDGFVLRRQKAGAWTVFNQKDGVPFQFIRSLAQGESGEIWGASPEAGLYVVRDGRFHAVAGMNSAARSVFVSRDGVIWAGTPTSGLCRLTPRRLAAYPVGLEERRVTVTGLVEAVPGEFVVATYGSGLFQGGLDRLEPVQILKTQVEHPHLTSVLKTRNGAVWVGGAGVLARREPGAAEFRAVSLTHNLVALCEGADGTLWLGSREGELLHLVGDQPQPVAQGSMGALVSALVSEDGSVLWAGTQGAGLVRWEDGRVQRWTTREGLPTDAVRTLHRDAAGTLWIGTAGGGIAWLEGGRIRVVNSQSGLGDDFISQILEDDGGNLWLGGNHGISRVSKRDLRAVANGQAARVHPLVMDEADGMLAAECTGGYSPAGWRSTSGALNFSTMLGVAVVNPAQFGFTLSPPTVLIEEVKLDGKPISWHGGELSLPPGSRELELHFTAFNYARPEQIRFRHRMEGREPDWLEVAGARSERYSRLSPGDYVFEVTAANLDGHWQESGAKLAFTVRPSFWQRWWFRAGSLAALFGFSGCTTWWLVHRRHQRTLQELELTRQHQAELAHVARVSNLGQLASSLAHELNQPLGAILRNAEAAELFLQDPSPDLEEIRTILADIRADDQRAGAVIDRMRGLMKRREVERRLLDLNVLVGEVVALVRSDAELRRVRLVLETNPALPPVQGDRVQLQQVLLNLVLNALDALNDNLPESRLVTLRTQPAGASIEVSVSDQGHGIPADKLVRVFEPFYTSKPNGLGMGLAISRSIIEAHGGRLWAENKAEGGAVFTFALPVTDP